MNISYETVTEIYSYNGETRIAFGIVALDDPNENGTVSIVASVRDVTPNSNKAKQFASLCNSRRLPVQMLIEAAEDFFV